jgi:phosphohistidine phosphatase
LRTVLLVRHAKSSWDDPSLTDRERPLSPRGLRAARWLGRHLAGRGLADPAKRPELILSSPAVRALKTARLVARRLRLRRRDIAVQENLYATTARRLLQALQALDPQLHRVMLVGHNPEISSLARRFSRSIAHLPTGSAACFTFDAPAWSDIGRDCLTRMHLDHFRKPRD